MKRDIKDISNNIENIINENTNNKILAEFKRQAEEIMYFKLKDLLPCGEYKAIDIFYKKEQIVGETMEELQRRKSDIIKISLLKPNDLLNYDKNVKRYYATNEFEKYYNFADTTYLYQLELIFDKVFKKINNEMKQQEKYQEEELKEVLKNYLYDLFNTKKRDISYKDLSINILTYKQDIIEDITQNETSKKLLDKIYVKTLNEVKREYTDIKEVKQNKIPLGWKAYGVYKGLKTIWKNF